MLFCFSSLIRRNTTRGVWQRGYGWPWVTASPGERDADAAGDEAG